VSDLNNIKVLATVAHESGAHEDSYKYNSKVLEIDIRDATAWVNKGIAAAFLTDTSGTKISEAKVLILKGIELGIDDSYKNKIITKLKEAYNNFVNQLNDELLGKVKDYQKVAMPSGGSAILHGFNQSVNKLLTAQSQASARVKGLELVVLMCEVKPEPDIFGLANLAFANLKMHSKTHGDYLTKNNDLLTKYNEYERFVANEAAAKCPGLAIPTPDALIGQTKGASSSNNQSGKEGCFIATAATGSYDHPKVMVLRHYRDHNLKTNTIGNLFVRTYYKVSPKLAKYVAKSKFLRKVVMMTIVNPLVFVIQVGKNSTAKN
jgi:hypothetical protein